MDVVEVVVWLVLVPVVVVSVPDVKLPEVVVKVELVVVVMDVEVVQVRLLLLLLLVDVKVEEEVLVTKAVVEVVEVAVDELVVNASLVMRTAAAHFPNTWLSHCRHICMNVLTRRCTQRAHGDLRESWNVLGPWKFYRSR